MIRFWRAGFGRDFIILLLVTVLLGSALSGALAALTERAFTGAVRSLIGDYGEYDIIVHVRDEAHTAALTALRELLQTKLPGARVKDSMALAGKANLLVAVPEKRKSRAVFESLPGWLAALPGYAGVTYIAEPNVTVRNVHAGVRADLQNKMADLAGVRFVYRDGSDLTAILDSPDQAEAVYKAVSELAAQKRVLEIRYPIGVKLDAPEQAAYEVEQALQDMWGKDAARDVTILGQDDEMSSFTAALSEMKRFLLSYATQVDIELAQKGAVIAGDVLELSGTASTGAEPAPADEKVQVRVYVVDGLTARAYVEAGDAEPYLEKGGKVYAAGSERRPLGQASLRNERLQLIAAIDTGLEMLGQLKNLANNADGAVKSAKETLQTFEAALVQLEAVQEQVRQINEELTQKGSVDAGQLLISALLSTMVRQMQGGTEPADLRQADVQGMQERLTAMSQQLDAMSKMDVNLISREITRIRDNLPRLTDKEIGDSLRLIDRYLEGQVLPGDRLQLLLAPGVDVAQSEALIRGVLGHADVTLFTSPAAVPSPDARSTLFSVLSQVRRTIAGLAALVLVVLSLLLDQATLFSAARRLGLRPEPWAALIGSVLLTGMYALSGAAVPGIALWHVIGCGAAIGWLCARLSLRLSPVDGEEIEAGVALGLNLAQVLREIVIPAGRPGLLMLLNRPRQAFR